MVRQRFAGDRAEGVPGVCAQSCAAGLVRIRQCRGQERVIKRAGIGDAERCGKRQAVSGAEGDICENKGCGGGWRSARAERGLQKRTYRRRCLRAERRSERYHTGKPGAALADNDQGDGVRAGCQPAERSRRQDSRGSSD